ncbi:unnamed protein product [Rodentolepis nana]|uniref:MH2 domain-containing protein n=1 Tax=Rodentolepis nana TaxID=102285 RepID=A0A0R3TCH2_RODNA|nr:unnamed protein product [Rodentolepis nana]
MNAYLGCVSGTDSRGSVSYGVRNRVPGSSHSTALAATLDRLASSANCNANGSAHLGRNNSVDAVQTIILKRSSMDTPWGFRIQGGQDYNLQLTVKKACAIADVMHIVNSRFDIGNPSR